MISNINSNNYKTYQTMCFFNFYLMGILHNNMVHIGDKSWTSE